jgi:hypothetical protein
MAPGHKDLHSDTIAVEEMADGGMGSLRFVRGEPLVSERCHEIARATYTDQDGVLVSIVVNGDESGHLRELDIWKTDFSPLVRFPRATELRHDAT